MVPIRLRLLQEVHRVHVKNRSRSREIQDPAMSDQNELEQAMPVNLAGNERRNVMVNGRHVGGACTQVLIVTMVMARGGRSASML